MLSLECRTYGQFQVLGLVACSFFLSLKLQLLFLWTFIKRAHQPISSTCVCVCLHVFMLKIANSSLPGCGRVEYINQCDQLLLECIADHGLSLKSADRVVSVNLERERERNREREREREGGREGEGEAEGETERERGWGGVGWGGVGRGIEKTEAMLNVGKDMCRQWMRERGERKINNKLKVEARTKQRSWNLFDSEEEEKKRSKGTLRVFYQNTS